MKTDYYVLLGIEETASFSEVKKAYRKKALLLHPDKNPDDVENTTRLFNEVRCAYETLSDPQERSWYDSHKFQILMEDGDSNTDIGGNDDSFETYYAGTSFEDIEKYMNPNLYQKFDDSINGFYSVVSVLLDKIASEEVTAGKQQKLPGFLNYKDDTSFATVCDPKELLYPRIGNSKTDFESTRMFYKVWSNFHSVKSFNWCDEYRYSTAPDRRTRRIMEKENKKLRELAKKKFNETVRKFISFIKKLDPRMDPKLKEKFEKEKLAKQREELKIQAQLEKEERQRQRKLFEEQEWQTVDPDDLAEIEAQLEKLYDEERNLNGEEDEDDFDNNLFECIICDKIFKSQKQFIEHEKSKKHIKLLKKLQWEMKREGIELGIDGNGFVQEDASSENSSEEFTDAVDELGEFEDDEEVKLDDLADLDHLTNEELEAIIAQQIFDEENAEPLKETVEERFENESIVKDEVQSYNDDTGASIDDRLDDDIYDDVEVTIKGKFKGDKTSEKLDELSQLLKGSKLDSDSDNDWGSTGKSKGKKNNRSKNKETSSNTKQSSTTKSEVCCVCQESFSSRNKLFQHVETSGHAAPPSKIKKKSKKGKNK
ncbi:hypothetical protein CANINC_004315 [Pichia inconspicua]|uniref:J domain-containing protein n=1 Tax=Pichia inconspicua TaxID=52247 RepID=A0A4T0WWL4_9ASCO|nr:hypothetical protein CANINC_004315 [[Candida] inconspicua]